MPSLDTVFIVNPLSGGGSTAARWPAIAARARKILGEFQAAVTRAPGEAGLLATHAVARGGRRLVVVGGDGTLNEVINAVMALDVEMQRKICLGIVPNGTGCDFAKGVSIPKDPGESLSLIAEAPTRSVDVGCIVFRDEKGQKSRRFFLNVASFGLGGEVARRVRTAPRALGPAFAFLWATVLAVLSFGKKRICLQIDGGSPRICRAWNVAVANGRYHGGGMLVAPDARPDDGAFHITVIGDLTLTQVFLNLRHLYNGRIHQVEGVFGFVGTRVEAASDLPVPLDVDGEGPGTLPAALTILPRALNLIAPFGWGAATKGETL